MARRSQRGSGAPPPLTEEEWELLEEPSSPTWRVISKQKPTPSQKQAPDKSLDAFFAEDGEWDVELFPMSMPEGTSTPGEANGTQSSSRNKRLRPLYLGEPATTMTRSSGSATRHSSTSPPVRKLPSPYSPLVLPPIDFGEPLNPRRALVFDEEEGVESRSRSNQELLPEAPIPTKQPRVYLKKVPKKAKSASAAPKKDLAVKQTAKVVPEVYTRPDLTRKANAWLPEIIPTRKPDKTKPSPTRTIPTATQAPRSPEPVAQPKPKNGVPAIVGIAALPKNAMEVDKTSPTTTKTITTATHAPRAPEPVVLPQSRNETPAVVSIVDLTKNDMEVEKEVPKKRGAPLVTTLERDEDHGRMNNEFLETVISENEEAYFVDEELSQVMEDDPADEDFRLDHLDDDDDPSYDSSLANDENGHQKTSKHQKKNQKKAEDPPIKRLVVKATGTAIASAIALLDAYKQKSQPPPPQQTVAKRGGAPSQNQSLTYQQRQEIHKTLSQQQQREEQQERRPSAAAATTNTRTNVPSAAIVGATSSNAPEAAGHRTIRMSRLKEELVIPFDLSRPGVAISLSSDLFQLLSRGTKQQLLGRPSVQVRYTWKIYVSLAKAGEEVAEPAKFVMSSTASTMTPDSSSTTLAAVRSAATIGHRMSHLEENLEIPFNPARPGVFIALSPSLFKQLSKEPAPDPSRRKPHQRRWKVLVSVTKDSGQEEEEEEDNNTPVAVAPAPASTAAAPSTAASAVAVSPTSIPIDLAASAIARARATIAARSSSVSPSSSAPISASNAASRASVANALAQAREKATAAIAAPETSATLPVYGTTVPKTTAIPPIYGTKWAPKT